jgi:adenosylcobyric acid synthase
MAKAIMIQGTMSNAGKSAVAAGICRILRQDGISCAPFKAQNMALNSFITKEGLEMGRSQVVQAEAAGIEPLAAMNPILLKPTTDIGSQVIVNGTAIGNMTAREYFAYKKKLVPAVMEAYESLASRYEVIVIEGAGSPAEINLKDTDYFVNMGMAKLAGAPVLLVGDIDRGGVFAQLYGTCALLDKDERAYIKGLIINKFRGDPSLLSSGIRMLEEKLNIPVIGTIPYAPFRLDDEDSLTERFSNGSVRERRGSKQKGGSGERELDLAVIRYPHISNFSDFSVFDMFDGVRVRYVTARSELGNPDLIVLPGSKDTIGDLSYIRRSHLADAILKRHAEGTLLFGICGGYQMLGESITDEEGAEHTGEARGLGLLPMRTSFGREKRRVQVEGSFMDTADPLAPLSGFPVSGYEMHMGRSERTDKECPALLRISSDEKKNAPDGMAQSGVFGTYVHGVFDDGRTCGRLLNLLARRSGLSRTFDETKNYRDFHETQYDLLADAVRSGLSLPEFYRILERGVSN